MCIVCAQHAFFWPCMLDPGRLLGRVVFPGCHSGAVSGSETRLNPPPIMSQRVPSYRRWKQPTFIKILVVYHCYYKSVKGRVYKECRRHRSSSSILLWCWSNCSHSRRSPFAAFILHQERAGRARFSPKKIL